jgi:phospholipid/cholesterol/gamma-HCH transport system substrate-binding protein
MERRPGLEWKVGLFILIALIFVGVMVFAMRGYRAFTPGYTIHVLLHAAGGLSRGAPVRFAGVTVGEVQTVTISRLATEALPQVIVSIWLPRDLTIRSDDRAQIGMLGLLGEKYLEIEPGADQGAIVQSGGQLMGEDPLSETAVIDQAELTLQRLDRFLERADTLLGPTGPLARLNQTLDRVDQFSEQLDETARQARSLMQPWQAVGERMNALLAGPERYLDLLVAIAGLIFALFVA